MADSEAAVMARLIAHAGTAALVNRRVWHSALPQDPTLPAITVQEISGVPESTMGDDTGHVRGTVQVDAWAAKRDGCKALAEQVRDALQRYVGTHEGSTLTVVGMNSMGVRYESDGRIWRASQDFELWWTETV